METATTDWEQKLKQPPKATPQLQPKVEPRPPIEAFEPLVGDVIFDIETGPLPEDVILGRLPPLDESSIKIGNRGAEKAAEYIVEQQALHLAKAVDRAALDPCYGQVLAIGYRSSEGGRAIDIADSDEERLLKNFWRQYLVSASSANRLIGFYSNTFDVPFIARRSFLLSIEVPGTILKGRYLVNTFVDLIDIWRCGDSRENIGLNKLIGAMGLGQKTGSGKDFARLLQEDRQAAVEYLKQDVSLTYWIAVNVGVIA